MVGVEVQWMCAECAEIGTLVSCHDDPYWIGSKAYSAHEEKSPKCKTEPCFFDIQVKKTRANIAADKKDKKDLRQLEQRLRKIEKMLLDLESTQDKDDKNPKT